MFNNRMRTWRHTRYETSRPGRTGSPVNNILRYFMASSMRRPKMKMVCGLLYAVCFSIFTNFTWAVSLEEIKAQAGSQMNTLTSIQFTSTFDDFLTTDSKHHNQGRIEYLQSENRYFIKSVLKNETSDNEDEFIAAYDGRQYQNFSRNTQSLDLKKSEITDTPNRFMNPILMAYSWLILGSPKATQQGTVLATCTDIQNQDLWEDCFKYAEITDTKGTSNIHVRFTNPENGVITEVTFGSDGCYYPLEIISTSKEGIETIQVKDFIINENQGNAFFLPLKVAVSSKTSDFSLDPTLQILPETIKINKPVDNEAFTIPESWAKTVTDLDTNPSEQDFPQSRLFAPLRICFMTLGIICLLIGFYCKFIQRKHIS